MRIRRVRVRPGGYPLKVKEVRTRRHVPPGLRHSHSTDVPSGGCDIEAFETSKHCPPSRRDHGTPRTHFRMDARWGTPWVHCRAPRCRQALPRAFYFHAMPNLLIPSQLSDVAEGLNYLHFCSMIHGDLNGVCDCSIPRSTIVFISGQSNILVDATGHARIVDFGLAAIDSTRSGSVEHDNSVQWIAPEIIDGRRTHSTEADIFSFAGVAIEVCRK